MTPRIAYMDPTKQGLINALEDLLDRCRKGEIRSIAAVTVDENGDMSYYLGGGTDIDENLLISGFQIFTSIMIDEVVLNSVEIPDSS